MALHYDPFWQDQLLSMSQYSFAPGYTNAASTYSYVHVRMWMWAKTLGLVIIGVINV